MAAQTASELYIDAIWQTRLAFSCSKVEKIILSEDSNEITLVSCEKLLLDFSNADANICSVQTKSAFNYLHRSLKGNFDIPPIGAKNTLKALYIINTINSTF